MPRQRTVIAREVKSIKSAFNQLARAFGRVGPLLAALNGGMESAPKRRKPRLSPAHRKALKLQGQYIGTMRGLRARQRATVKKIRAAKGIRAAIKEARRLAE